MFDFWWVVIIIGALATMYVLGWVLGAIAHWMFPRKDKAPRYTNPRETQGQVYEECDAYGQPIPSPSRHERQFTPMEKYRQAQDLHKAQQAAIEKDQADWEQGRPLFEKLRGPDGHPTRKELPGGWIESEWWENKK
jgi:hypothetical protein